MSRWFEASLKDMELSNDRLSVSIGYDRNGTNYVHIKISDIVQLLDQQIDKLGETLEKAEKIKKKLKGKK